MDRLRKFLKEQLLSLKATLQGKQVLEFETKDWVRQLLVGGKVVSQIKLGVAIIFEDGITVRVVQEDYEVLQEGGWIDVDYNGSLAKMRLVDSQYEVVTFSEDTR